MGLATPYPSDVMEEALTLYKMLRQQIPADKQVAVKCGYNISGYGLRLGVGEPGTVAAKAAALSVEQAEAVKLAQLDDVSSCGYDGANPHTMQLLGVLAGQPAASGLLGGVLAGFGKEAALKLLLPYLMRWVQNWVNEGGLEDFINNLVRRAAPAA